MFFEYIKNIFNSCELLKDFTVYTDYLSDSCNSISIIPKDSHTVIRSYSDGGKILGFEFDIIVRLGMNSDDNTRNYDLLDDLVNWIISFDPSLKDTFSEGDDTYSPLRINFLEGPVLADDNIHSGKYKIKCRLDCIYKHFI